MVETPGATSAFTVSSTWRTICPLRRILSSSACDLQLIIRCRCRAAFQRAKNLPRHLLDRKLSLDPAQASLLPVIIFQRQGLAFIALQTLRDDCFRIVNALDQ